MSSQTQKNKVVNFSHALYNKNSQLYMNEHVTGSIRPQHQNVLGTHYKILMEFNSAGLSEQRDLLNSNAKGVVEAYVHAIVRLDTNKEVLNYLLPSLDGILFGKAFFTYRNAFSR